MEGLYYTLAIYFAVFLSLCLLYKYYGAFGYKALKTLSNVVIVYFGGCISLGMFIASFIAGRLLIKEFLFVIFVIVFLFGIIPYFTYYLYQKFNSMFWYSFITSSLLIILFTLLS